jgi:hypothetical protein
MLNFLLGFYAAILIVCLMVTFHDENYRTPGRWFVDIASCFLWPVTIPIGLIIEGLKKK